jgi:hypothetical protein
MAAQPTVPEHVLQCFHCNARATAVVVQYDAAQSNGANLTGRMGMSGAVVERGKEEQCREAWCDVNTQACLCHSQASNATTSKR